MIKIVTAYTLIMWTGGSSAILHSVTGIRTEAACIEAQEQWDKKSKGWIRTVCVPTYIPAIQEGTGQ